MGRARSGPRVMLAALGLAVIVSTRGAAQEPAALPAAPERPVELRFLDGLRERGYFDLGLEYLDELRREADVPAAVKDVLDFEEGKALVEEAKFAPDLQRREQLFNLARVKLDEFLKGHVSHPGALEARVLLAQLLYQRGQTEALKAGEAPTDALKQDGLKAARTSYGQARKAFEEAIEPLQAAYDAFPPGFIEEDDPRFKAREQAQIAVLDARLKRSLVDYEDAQTYPLGSDERNQRLETAITEFKGLHDKYRNWMAGFAAQMWQGKCYEEQGDLRGAMGIYDQLLDHKDPRLYSLQRQVAFFKIIGTGKRKEYPLAERLAREWLVISKGDQGSYERIGVQLELAKSLDKQIEAAKSLDLARKKAAVEDIVGQLTQIVRIASPFKAEAVALLRKYRPTGGVDPKSLANLSFDQALSKARESLALEEYESATVYLRTAIARVNAARDADKANQARYLLAYAEYQQKHFYEAAVLSSFLARRYPKWESSPQAAELAMSAMALAYDDLPGAGREAELARLDDLAKAVEANFKDEDQADVARILRGDIALGQGRYADASAVFETVQSPSRKLDAQAKAAAAYWRQSLVARKREEGAGSIPAEAAEAAAKARGLLEKTIRERREAQALPTDADLLSNVADLAEIHVAEGRAGEALALLEPATKSLGAGTPDAATRPVAARVWKLQLQAHIADGKTDAAVLDMKALEQANQGEPLTQLFFGLGRLLEKEMDAQKARGDRATLSRTQAAYGKFLDALVASAGGQSFESLQWAGESMLALNKPDRALELFDRVLKDYPTNERINRTKLRRVTALRNAGRFKEAWAEVDELVRANPRGLDFLLERCNLLEDWAKAEKGRWNTAIKYWTELAKLLERQKPRPPEFYDSWYHVAWCYQQAGNVDYARRTLKSIMAVSSALGSPEIKSKYEQLLKRLGT